MPSIAKTDPPADSEPGVAEAIDRAAQEGASPEADIEHPVEEIIETPEQDRVDPDDTSY